MSRIVFGADGNVFLSRLRRTDLLFRVFRHVPRPVRDRLIDGYVHDARQRAEGRSCPERMTIFLTNQCDMKCAHCFIVKEIQPKLEVMTLEEYRKLFTSVRGRVSQVLLTGGEPTLRKDFADIVVAASRDGRVPTANVFSNGLRGEKIVAQLQDILERCDITLNFQTSIDGLREFHDANRRVPGAFDRALDTIRKVQGLARRHPGRFGRMIAATAISRQNLGRLEEICDTVMATGASPAFSFVRTSDDVFNLRDPAFKSDFAPEETKADGSSKFATADYLDVEKMDRALDIIDRKVWQHDRGRLHFSYNRVTMGAVRDLKATSRSPLSAECRMGYDDVVVLADGFVSRCEMLVAPVSLRDFDFDLPRMLGSAPWQGALGATAGCWCTHDCGIGVSMMKEPTLLKKLSGADRAPVTSASSTHRSATDA